MLQMVIKTPGVVGHTQSVQMDFCYGAELPSQSGAYKRVLTDVFRGDGTIVASSDEVMECWRIIQPVIDGWNQNRSPLVLYPCGSWGPDSAAELVQKDGAEWLTKNLQTCSDHHH